MDNYYGTSYNKPSNVFGSNSRLGSSASTSLNQPPPSASPLTNAYKAYNAASTTQAGDYDNIMKGYQNFAQNAQNTPQMNFTPFTPQTYNYQSSPDVTSALASLKGLADTGGYSDSDIQELRARGVSPIRSVYSSAQQNIERQKALQGGYSPNYTAATAKMSRDMADSIGNQMSNVNAGIAQNVASNKLSAAPSYANAAGQQSALQNSIGENNMNTQNQAGMFNSQMPLEYAKYNLGVKNNQLSALGGMTSLYGTNPALMSAFGNQALGQGNLQQNIRQGNQNYNLNMVGKMIQGLN
jgi:hypothetical protein